MSVLPVHYPIEWEATPEGLAPFYVDGHGERVRAVWAPQYGSQHAFLRATSIFEVLYEGERGPGKTDALLMDFLQHVGKGYGEAWRGVIFRETFPQLSDVISKSQKWFRLIFPGARYNKQDHRWDFPTGEVLYFRHMAHPDDYWNFHGHAYPWIGWEELCNWPDDKCYKVMMSCCRSSTPGMPRCYRATTNPYGCGHNWVKSRFQLPHMRGRIIRGLAGEPPRVAIQGRLEENKILLHADPDYIRRITEAARNPSELAAWLEGSWDIVAGGMFDDVWQGGLHVVPSFPLNKIPRRWIIDRAYDHGSSKPFACAWFAESNGEPFEYQGRLYGRVPGDLYMIQEWYGWNGNRNEGLRMLAGDIAQGILDREDDWGIANRVRPGPADSAIFDDENGSCVARDMRDKGVRWEASLKGPGSRVKGWEAIRKLLRGACRPIGGGPREMPGLFITDVCRQAIEILPTLPRSHKNLDDVDTDSEDHIGDMLRYRVRRKEITAGQSDM